MPFEATTFTAAELPVERGAAMSPYSPVETLSSRAPSQRSNGSRAIKILRPTLIEGRSPRLTAASTEFLLSPSILAASRTETVNRSLIISSVI